MVGRSCRQKWLDIVWSLERCFCSMICLPLRLVPAHRFVTSAFHDSSLDVRKGTQNDGKIWMNMCWLSQIPFPKNPYSYLFGGKKMFTFAKSTKNFGQTLSAMGLYIYIYVWVTGKRMPISKRVGQQLVFSDEVSGRMIPCHYAFDIIYSFFWDHWSAVRTPDLSFAWRSPNFCQTFAKTCHALNLRQTLYRGAWCSDCAVASHLLPARQALDPIPSVSMKGVSLTHQSIRKRNKKRPCGNFLAPAPTRPERKLPESGFRRKVSYHNGWPIRLP